MTDDLGEHVTHHPRAALGARVDEAALVRRLRAWSDRRFLDPACWRWSWSAFSGRSPAPLPLRVSRSLNESVAQRMLATLRDAVSVAPEPAALDADGFLVAGRDGRTIDLAAAVGVVRGAILADETYVQVPVRTIPAPALPMQPLAAATYEETLAEGSSRYAFRDDSWNRAQNVERAAEELDGTIVPPYGVLSFNDIVGERSFERGFMPAKEIRHGEYIDGIGGGVCQVATLLHAAALRAGFEIEEHHTHSRRVAYAELGTDASVAWPYGDLRVRNPYSFHVRVHARAHEGALSLSLRGDRAVPPVALEVKVIRGRVEGNGELVVERTRRLRGRAGERVDRAVLHYPAVGTDASVDEGGDV